jgi:hypothetical protein
MHMEAFFVVFILTVACLVGAFLRVAGPQILAEIRALIRDFHWFGF